jgi:DNA modification methylase
MNINEIKPNPNNPRIIKDDKFKKLVKSIQDFPQMLELRPIVIDENNIVLGGNMRLKACIEAGLKDVPVKQAKELTEEQKKEFIVKDNVGYGEWDWDDLANNWNVEDLTEWGLDIPNFDVNVLEAEEDGFSAPEGGTETDIVLGDLFEIGEHRLLCGDSTDSDQVAKLMNGQKADMVFTDPPYGINLNTDLSNIKTEKNGWKGKGGKYDKIIGDDKDYDPSHIFIQFHECDNIFLWGADYYSHLIPNRNEGCFFVWDKVQNENGKGISWNLGSMFELCWSKKKYKREIIRKLWAGLYGTETQDIRKRVHPTQKPIELCTWFLNKEDCKLIIDLFLGSGSTMVASHQLKRNCFGMELDPKYCQVIVDRMKKLDPSLIIKKNGVAL